MIINKLIKSVSGRLLSVLMAFASAIVCGRVLDKVDAAFYFWVVSGSAFFSLIISCGLNQIIHRLMSEAKKNGTKDSRVILTCYKYMTYSFAAVFLFSIIFYITTLRFGPRDVAEKILTAVLCGFFLSISTFAAEIFRHRDMHFYSGMSSGLYINFGLILFVFLNKIFLGFSIGFVLTAAYFFGSMLSVVGLVGEGVFLKPSGVFVIAKQELYYNIFIGVCSFVVMQAHVFMVGLFFDGDLSADFSAAARLSALMLIVPPMIHQASAKDYIGRFYGGGSLATSILVRKMTLISSAIVFPVFLLMFLVPEYVISLVFGDRYIGGAVVLKVLAAAAFINIIRGPSGTLLVLLGFSKIQAFITGWCSLIVFCFMLFGSLRGEVIFLAYSVFIGVVLQGAAEAFQLKNNTDIRIY